MNSLTHDHVDGQLVNHCSGCIALQQRSDFISSLPLKTDEQLVEILMARDHIATDWLRLTVENELARREQPLTDPTPADELTLFWDAA